MKNLIFAIFALLLLFVGSASADDVADLWRENSAGMNVLITNGTPNVVQIVFASTAVDSIFAIDFPGDEKNGLMFTMTAVNPSAVPDTIVHYYFTSTAKNSGDKIRADSTKFVVDAVSERVLNFFVAEGDTMRWVKRASGNGRLEIGGVKNLRGRYLSDY